MGKWYDAVKHVPGLGAEMATPIIGKSGKVSINVGTKDKPVWKASALEDFSAFAEPSEEDEKMRKALRAFGMYQEPPMDEATWLTCGDPKRMLQHLDDLAHPIKTDRKLRLFAVACAHASGDDAQTWEEWNDDWEHNRAGAISEGRLFPLGGAQYWCGYKFGDKKVSEKHPRKPTPTEAAQFANLLREIFGNPFQPEPGYRPVGDLRRCERCGHVFDEKHHHRWTCPECGTKDKICSVREKDAWLSWNDGTVVKLAQRMYESRDFSGMPILGDALEEAGCTDEAILKHCRTSAGHCRGCWVVDLLLNKS